ncbi:hypothetical protein LBW60_23445 [Ralstonia solanacearum]|uniref:hypothetical protein n=1 Tax=Ralstonia solanacearum TaxID=305 RepID=UPI00230541A9|nr:hypothetical protein [Ralstonia solanacearum]MDB0516276.1 hypothetical protein [Ralstonia solanacearum]
MIYHDIYQIAVAVVCFTIAGLIVHHFRHLLHPRKKGESLREFVTRTHEEKQLDKQAKHSMLGRWTLPLNLMNVTLLLLTVWLSKFEVTFVFLVFGYLAIGFILTRGQARAARRPDYHRLGMVDRLYYRMSFAWAWPFFFLKPSN